MPWAIVNRPSVQLGALHGYLRHHCPDIAVNSYHPYLEIAKEIGFDTYQLISRNNWAGECLYSTLLFPENKESARSLFYASLQGDKRRLDFDHLTGILARHMDAWIKSSDFNNQNLIGFSICFSQLIASLYAVTKIKQFHPTCKIVLGGSVCTPAIGVSLLKSFNYLDYIVTGEGEEPLRKLCRHLASKKSEPFPDNGSILSRQTLDDQAFISPANCCSDEIHDLNTLPPPYYDDYFTRLGSLGLTFIPTLPVEFSRGCWWNKCTFCNLNLQWAGYRHKKGDRMEMEIEYLSRRHGTLDFTFTDNALPPVDSRSFFASMAEKSGDLHFFAEIRAAIDPAIYHLYKNGGLNSVQVGIESLSTSLLKRMKKGVGVMENIAAMKNGVEAGITLEGNLILEFPGSTQEEVEQTLRALDAVLPFHPLDSASFFLGSGSPIHCNPKDFGIRSIRHHPHYNKLFPPSTLTTLKPLIYSYHGDRARQKKLWQPVRDKIAAWKKFHANRDNRNIPALFYRNGDDFLIIRQELPSAPTLHHRLKGKSKDIYLACRHIVTRKELLETFKSINTKQLCNFLDGLVDKNLLYREEDRYLALAVHYSTR